MIHNVYEVMIHQGQFMSMPCSLSKHYGFKVLARKKHRASSAACVEIVNLEKRRIPRESFVAENFAKKLFFGLCLVLFLSLEINV